MPYLWRGGVKINSLRASLETFKSYHACLLAGRIIE